jgi:ankyrin repeat protein
MADNWEAEIQRDKLHFAAKAGDLSEVEELLKAKYPVNRFDQLGKTPLHYAVEHDHLNVADRLIRAGADVNAHDERLIGNTPLSDNAKKISFEMAQRLTRAGADPTIRGWMQLSALDRAAERTDADAKKIQQLLLEAANSKRGPKSRRR